MIFNENYEYIKLLGEGGFGRVALAKDLLADRLVAIKWLKEPDTKKQRLIIQEIKTVAGLGYQNVVTFYHHFNKDGHICIVMEYCEGGSLRSKLNHPLFPGVVLPWFEIISETIHKVNLKRFIHHDIKPDNILFTASDEVRISDFGVVNQFAGTSSYMAPEIYIQSKYDIHDPRTDVFALGVTLLETLTLKNPFFGKSPNEKKEIIQNRSLQLGLLPEWLQNIIYKALDPIPEFRFQSALEFSEAIKSQYAPVILDSNLIKSGRLASKAENLIRNKKWNQAHAALETALILQPDNLKALKEFGEYYLLQNNIDKANVFFSKLLKLNPRAEVHKQHGLIQLESEKHREAISLLNDYLQRNPSDTAAHNLLCRSFIELGLYEQAVEYLNQLIKIFPQAKCFRSNIELGKILLKANSDYQNNTNKKDEFTEFNYSVLNSKPECWDEAKKGSLKSKLLFREDRFENIGLRPNEIEIEFPGSRKKYLNDNSIIPFGRWGFPFGLFHELKNNSVSRLHFAIINSKNDIWLYNLSSLGTWVDNIKVSRKMFLHGLHNIKTGDYNIQIKTSPNLLM